MKLSAEKISLPEDNTVSASCVGCADLEANVDVRDGKINRVDLRCILADEIKRGRAIDIWNNPETSHNLSAIAGFIRKKNERPWISLWGKS
ncbi:hypothetical protein HZC21_03260 [Candidatus Peregrinibacteria bacterium]|nr:hypothetical protein [Candidatus Peregrinibacteria bacterium]